MSFAADKCLTVQLNPLSLAFERRLPLQALNSV